MVHEASLSAEELLAFSGMQLKQESFVFKLFGSLSGFLHSVYG